MEQWSWGVEMSMQINIILRLFLILHQPVSLFILLFEIKKKESAAQSSLGVAGRVAAW